MQYISETGQHWTRPPQKVTFEGVDSWVGRCTCGATTMAHGDPEIVAELIHRHAVMASIFRKRAGPG